MAVRGSATAEAARSGVVPWAGGDERERRYERGDGEQPLRSQRERDPPHEGVDTLPSIVVLDKERHAGHYESATQVTTMLVIPRR